MSRRRSPGDPRRSNLMWTQDEEVRLTDMWNAGYADEFIARQLGRTRFAVVGRRDRLGLGKRLSNGSSMS